MKALTSLLLLVAASFTLAQDNPTAIAKKDLPKAAVCTICSAKGEGHNEEKPAAGLLYKGKAYYFCNAGEVPTFKKSPDFFLPLEIPMPLPNLEVKDTTGKSWDKAAFEGKIVLLDYWATWCKPCLALKPDLDKLRDRLKDSGFEVLSISIDEKQATMDKFLQKANWSNPVAWDAKQSWSQLRIAAIPALFLVKNGNIIAEFRGKIDLKAVTTAVEAAVKG